MTEQIQQATIFLDLNDDLKKVVEEAAPRCSKFIEGCGSHKSFISLWEGMKGQVTLRSAEDPPAVPAMQQFEGFVTTQSVHSADVTYALYTRRIPVLSLYDATEEVPSTTTLLSTIRSLGVATAEDAIRSFLSFPSNRGRLIVIEGGDGSGKQTQTELLADRLKKEGKSVATLDFPHDAAAFGVLIRRVLSGEFGGIRDLNVTLFSALYGLNRHDTLPQIRYWIQKGTHVILDRYMTANFGHQSSKFDKEEDRIASINTILHFETRWLGLPEPDHVLYLKLPFEVAMRAMFADTSRRALDIHETAAVAYKTRVQESFVWCSTYFKNWTVVPCMSESGERITRHELHETIRQIILPLIPL